MKKIILDFLREEEGLTTVEYAVAGALVAAAVVAAFTTLGENVGTVINGIAANITTP
jgi:pilus assembly protein Flp/PilA